MRLDARVARWATRDRDVGLVAEDDRQHPIAIAHLESEPDLGMQRRERLHERRDERLGGGRDRGDPQAEPAARLRRMRRAAAPRRAGR